LLADVAREGGDGYDRSIRLLAVEKITDQTILTDIAKDGCYDENVRMAAVEIINGNVVLADIAKNAYVNTAHGLITSFGENRVVVYAVQRISDQDILADIAKDKSYYLFVRMTAVEWSNDQSRLADIANNAQINTTSEIDTSSGISTLDKYKINNYAIRRMTDKTLLSDLAQNAKKQDVHEAAEKRLGEL